MNSVANICKATEKAIVCSFFVEKHNCLISQAKWLKVPIRIFAVIYIASI